MRIYISHADSAGGFQAASIIKDILLAHRHEVPDRGGGIIGGLNWKSDTKKIIENSDLVMVIVSPQYFDNAVGAQEQELAIKQGVPIIYMQIQSIPVGIQFPEGIRFEPLLDLRNFDRSSWETPIIEFLKDWRKSGESDQPRETKEIAHELALAELPDRIFIAYSHKQKHLAQELDELLRTNGKAVFWDTKIKAGAVWRQTIQKALEDATHVIVIWTIDAASSDEVEREVSYALAKRKTIVPILSKDLPELPYHLYGLHYIVLEDDLKKIEAGLLAAIARTTDEDDLWH
jgi:hypothetical protein